MLTRRAAVLGFLGLAGAGDAQPDDASERDEVRALRTALARLSDADLRVIHLRHLAGLSYAPVAQVIG